VSNRVGEENSGWTYAKFLLGHERTGIAGVAGSKRKIAALKEMAAVEHDNDGRKLADSQEFMNTLNEIDVRLNSLEAVEARVIAHMEATGAPGDSASMLKIIGTEIQQALQELTVEAVAYYALPFDVALIRGEINEPPIGPKYAESAVSDMNFGRAASIYGGSNEIQRNVIAKGVLGL